MAAFAAASAGKLLDDAHGTQLQLALKTLSKLLANILENPAEPKHVKHATALNLSTPP